MPTRPRSHQLEDISITRFKAAIPPAWVVRERSRDYGIDLEVEVFTGDGEATGLIFYVQLRATDDAAKGQKLRFNVEQLEYFRILDLPTAIVRYSATQNVFYLMWSFEAPEARPDRTSQTLTFNAAQQWAENTPDQIVRTLGTLRALNSQSPADPIAVSLIDDQADSNQSYALQMAFETFRKLGFIAANGAPNSLLIEVRSGTGGLTMRLDRLPGVQVEQSPRAEDLTAALGWSAVRLMWRLGLKALAQTLAQRCVGAGYEAPTPSLALSGALALLPDVAAAVDLACRAGIHKRQDDKFIVLTLAIHSQGLSSGDVDRRIALFRRSLESDAHGQDAASQAALNYSIGNVFRGAGRFGEAVTHYNRARKLRPAYVETAYFWAELGGCCYLRRKFRAAARAYDRALALAPGPRLARLAADALLGAGDLAHAAELFEMGSVERSIVTPGEAVLKAELCQRLAEKHGGRIDRPTRRLPPMWTLAAVDGDWEAILTVDPLDPLANFNAGKDLADRGETEEAFWRFFTAALMQPGDCEAWCNAISCALILDPFVLSVVLHLALFHCQREPYDQLRGRLIAQDRKELVPLLDGVVRDILAIPDRQVDCVAIRLFDGEQFRHMLDVPVR